MATIQSIYLGELRTQATHLESGTLIYTDAPKDNQGLGSCFSPTDLLATSLGACMLTIMAIAAKTHGFEHKLIDAKIDITKIMSADPRRVGEVKVVFSFREGVTFTDKEKAIIINSTKTCPVALSLHPETIKSVSFNF
jgi:uncharacterized OsmC-like protein